MKIFFFLILSLSVFAADPVLTSATKENSGCNVKLHLGLKDKKEFLTFHDRHVKLVKKDDFIKVASLINYPLRVFSNSSIVIKDRNDFIENYERVFNKKIKSIILNQDRRSFFCKSSGLMYGEGEVWINKFNSDKKLKITSISLK